MPTISCVILTHRSYEEKSGCIRHAIASLAWQYTAPDEVVIVSNGSSESEYNRLSTDIDGMRLPFDCRTIRTAMSMGQAKNAGATAASGDIVVFMDEDVILVDRTAISQVAELSRTYAHGYGAQRLWTPNGEWFGLHAKGLLADLVAGNEWSFIQSCGEPHPSIRRKSSSKYLNRTFIGSFGYTSRSLFKDVGGFPAKFEGYGCDDDALSLHCYLAVGRPSSLASVVSVHVSHHIHEVQYRHLRRNQVLWEAHLKGLGLSSFHIGMLLYPDDCQDTQVLEYIMGDTCD